MPTTKIDSYLSLSLTTFFPFAECRLVDSRVPRIHDVYSKSVLEWNFLFHFDVVKASATIGAIQVGTQFYLRRCLNRLLEFH